MKKTEIPQYRREMFFKIMGNQADLSIILFFLHKHPRCDDFCRWLIKTGIVDRGLYLFLKKDFDYKGKDDVIAIQKFMKYLEIRMGIADDPVPIIMKNYTRVH